MGTSSGGNAGTTSALRLDAVRAATGFAAPATEYDSRGPRPVLRASVESVVLQFDADLHPDLKFALDYWESKKAGRLAPRRIDIDPLEIAPLLPRITLVDVLSAGADCAATPVPGAVAEPGPMEFRYRLAGTGIFHVYGRELTNKYAHDIEPAALGEMICRHYAEAVTRATPALHRISLDVDASRSFYLRLILPLSDNGSTIGRLMTVESYPESVQSLRNCFFEAQARP